MGREEGGRKRMVSSVSRHGSCAACLPEGLTVRGDVELDSPGLGGNGSGGHSEERRETYGRREETEGVGGGSGARSRGGTVRRLDEAEPTGWLVRRAPIPPPSLHVWVCRFF